MQPAYFSESDDDSVVVETTEKVEGPLAPQGSICETYNLYRSKPDEDGRTVWTDKIPDNLAQPSENSVSNQYAIVVRRVKSYDANKTLNIQSISIQSKPLKDVLAKVFKGYSGITMSLDKVEFQRPFKPFVHRWDQLRKARDEEQDPALKSLIELLHDTLFEELSDTFSRKKDLIANGVVTHDLLWTLFEPGDVIYETVEEYPRAFIFRGYHEDRCGNFIISAGYIDFNGKKFGESSHSSQIPPFEGTAPITALPVLPLSYHPDKAKISDLLISRGRVWERYRGYHYKHYEGIAEGNFLGRPVKFNVNSRVVIDTAGYNKFTPNGSVFTVGIHYDELEDAQRLLTTPMLRGYVLKDKKWLDFYLDGVRDIAWNENAFESLVLPHAHQNLKSMILSFAKAQSDNLDTFDDFIQGKGKGVIMLLSGPPGVGKTLTAESVAEVMKVPLYMLSAGDLGTSARRVEETLRDVLEMVPRWGALLLLDEADVFMEERNSTDLERNELVSIFLRLLEYYELRSSDIHQSTTNILSFNLILGNFVPDEQPG